MPGKAAKGSTPQERSAAARARLLAAACELFYAEGVQSVGIDRVIEHAGVAKATLYSAFGSKEELVRAYLRARHAATMQRMSDVLEARYPTARERLVGVFEVQGLSFTDPGFRGCAFVGAKAEARPGGAVDEVADEYRAWLHGLFAGSRPGSGRDRSQGPRPAARAALRRRGDQRLAGPRSQCRRRRPRRGRRAGQRRYPGRRRRIIRWRAGGARVTINACSAKSSR